MYNNIPDPGGSNGVNDPNLAANMQFFATTQTQATQAMNAGSMMGQMGPPSMLPPQMPFFPPQPQGNGSTSWSQPQPQNHLAGMNGMTGGNPGMMNPAMQQQQLQLQAQQFQMQQAMPLYSLMMNEVMKLNMNATPVGSFTNDEDLLVQVLRASASNSQTYKQAIESLQGMNNHSAHMWKDYYLDNKHRLDEIITQPVDCSKLPPNNSSQARAPSRAQSSSSLASSSKLGIVQAKPHHRLNEVQKRTVRKPSFSSSPPPESSSRTTQSSSPNRNLQRRRRKEESSSRQKSQKSQASFRTLSGRLVNPSGESTSGNQWKGPWSLPEPPPRSPSPPANIAPARSGKEGHHAYTDEDKDFFIKTVSWEAKLDPNVSRKAILEKLTSKAPHHSYQSWNSYWRRDDDLADKILAARRGDESDDESDSGSESDQTSAGSAGSARSSGSPSNSSESDSGSDSDRELNSEEEHAKDLKKIGAHGDSYGKAEMRVIARFIASYDNWDGTTNKIRWGKFLEDHKTDRSAKSLAEYYRRAGTDIDRLVEKIKTRWEKRKQPIDSQLGRPSWAQGKSSEAAAALKRKLEHGEDDPSKAGEKRQKAEGSPNISSSRSP
ncbi:hypothetical protein JAAARDRAFT_53646 [Jaapia argillacea MUCL 33604]|uniref:Uncharacterized protein n=1 Tax=Jaapia argillacea MUCL 33604 TaxID=933084 RepID=A0A067Q8S9_9AGAM|nr:hypothetical protein JAAARDRAFT_53646 [Jaapia argillacea MUCL 33604]